VTHLVKHFLPGLWLFWLASGACIALLLALWRPRLWLVAAGATAGPLLVQMVLSVSSTPPTAWALAVGYALVWGALTFLGALAGRLLSPQQRRR